MKLKVILIVGTTALFLLGAWALERFTHDIGLESSRAADRARQEAAQREADWIAQKAANAKAWGTWVVRGPIIQKLPDGLLIESVGGMTKPAYNQRHEDWRPERPEPIRLPSRPRPPEEWKRIYAEIEKATKLEAERRTKSAPVKLEESLPIYEGTCLLLDHPLEAGKVDGDTVNVKVLYDGHFTYQTVLGATRTVRAFWALPIEKQ